MNKHLIVTHVYWYINYLIGTKLLPRESEKL